MRTGNGIIVAQDGKTFGDELAYDSRQSHLIIDSAPALKHMDIFEIKAAAAATTYPYNGGGSKTEERWKIEHGLPFIPRVGLYMNVRDAAAAQAALIGDYNSQVSVSSFPVEEMLYFSVDAQYVRLMYKFTVSSTGQAGSYTSVLQDILVRVKYMIFNNIGSEEPYNGDYYGL